MKRRVVNLVTLLSLLLCVAAVALWVRGLWLGEMYWSASAHVDERGTLHRRFWRVTSGGGAVEVYCAGGSTPRREFERLFPVGREAEYGQNGNAAAAAAPPAGMTFALRRGGVRSAGRSRRGRRGDAANARLADGGRCCRA